ncbi:hypothetical protein NDU88_007344 [Pleurodeles waltl]|uniref:Uncharacterized protein n=1 Tax=Pleurodeles waltl TaxID=8319 RepID=A0AAV7VU41_PLEWA|nr:hypothetical protein NDU88_007344 [Pleurodeles waltl]
MAIFINVPELRGKEWSQTVFLSYATVPFFIRSLVDSSIRKSAEVTPKGALPAAQVPERLAAAILSPRALFRLASSPFVSKPKLVVFRGTKPNIDSPRGHHAFRSNCTESGAELRIIAPGVRKDRQEPQEEAATAMAPSHAPQVGPFMLRSLDLIQTSIPLAYEEHSVT